MNYKPVNYSLVSHQAVNLCYVVPALVVRQVSSPVVASEHDLSRFDSGNGSVDDFEHSSSDDQPILSWADEVEAERIRRESNTDDLVSFSAELSQPEPVGLARFDVNLQAENFDLRDENNALRTENNNLKMELAALKEEKLRSASLDVEVVEDAKIKAILEAINVSERVMNRLPAKDPSVLARIEALLRMKDELTFKGHFTKECKRLIGGYKNVDGRNDESLMIYLRTANHNQFLSALFEMYYDNHSKDEVVSLLSYLHKFNFNVNLDKQALIDVTRVKYNNNIDSNDVSIKVDFDDLVPGSDHVYGTHALEGFPLAMMHALSHVDSTINGKGLAKYHVGAACRMNECSIVEVFNNGVSKKYKPFKCWDSYVILPTLEGEVNGRVEAVLHHVGVTYITLVRCYDKLDRLRAKKLHHHDYLINGSVSRTVSTLANKYKLKTFDMYFTEDGLCVHAIGCRHNMMNRVNCCYNSYQRNGEHQRTHKQPGDNGKFNRDSVNTLQCEFKVHKQQQRFSDKQNRRRQFNKFDNVKQVERSIGTVNSNNNWRSNN
uniref:VP5 protein n=1 Tax=Kadipiro virus TaxID=104580 RepID=A0A8F1D6J5_9REOV|nr:MAG: VP5 protein [Kadipiro virus]